MEYKFIDKIGIELEGGWNENPFPDRIRYDGDGNLIDYYGSDAQWHDDGSVSSYCAYRGEIVSSPLTPEKLDDWVKSYYPNDCNSSCGLHVHLSFKDMTMYQGLMDKVFNKMFIDKLIAWGKAYPIKNETFWQRVEGRNNFCHKKWNADFQAKLRGKQNERYTMLNFCYSIHGTMEIRVLPMFKDVDVSLAAIKKCLGIVEEYLEIAKPKIERVANVTLKFIPEELEPLLINVSERM